MIGRIGILNYIHYIRVVVKSEIIRLIGYLNYRIEGRTLKEYYIDNKDELVKKQKTL